MERADLDWKNLGFTLLSTDHNLLYTWKDGAWGDVQVRTEETLVLPLGATALHYGQSIFEGLKAFETVDGEAVLFRPEKNGERMANGARKLLMQSMPVDEFVTACKEAVRLNRRFLPPCDSGAALYVRPLLYGAGGRLGVRPAEEYAFCIFVTPVGPYFGSDLQSIRLVVEEESHRAAPRGVGDVKAAGNYAAGMRAIARAKERGYDNVLYLDSRHGRFIDETGATNFFGIRENADGSATYVTPLSHSILPSITNESLCQIARDLGMTVERRPVEVSELGEFSEVGCCGTAAVITPVGSIQWREESLQYGDVGPRTRKLYETLTGIQRGTVPDTHGWLTRV